MSEIGIHKDIIAGMATELKDPAKLNMVHNIAKVDNPLLHIFHTSIEAGFSGVDYPDDIRRAISIGASLYETLQGASRRPSMPMEFAVQFLADSERNPNFGLHLVDQMIEAKQDMIRYNPDLALGVQAICSAHIAQQEYVGAYAVGGAALMDYAYRDAHQFWQLEQAEWPDGVAGNL